MTIEYDACVFNLMGCCGSQASNVMHAPALNGQRTRISMVSGWVEVRPEAVHARKFQKQMGRDLVHVEGGNKDQQKVHIAQMRDSWTVSRPARSQFSMLVLAIR